MMTQGFEGFQFWLSNVTEGEKIMISHRTVLSQYQ